MAGSEGASVENNYLKELANTSGIPELQAFEHDSDKLEFAQDELRKRLETIEGVDELLDDPLFRDEEPTDDLTDEDLRSNQTIH